EVVVDRDLRELVGYAREDLKSGRACLERRARFDASVDRAKMDLRDPPPCARVSKPIERGVRRRAVEPGGDGAPAVKLIRTAEERGEHLLQDLPRVLFVAQNPARAPEHRMAVIAIGALDLAGIELHLACPEGLLDLGREQEQRYPERFEVG